MRCSDKRIYRPTARSLDLARVVHPEFYWEEKHKQDIRSLCSTCGTEHSLNIVSWFWFERSSFAQCVSGRQ